MDSPWRKGEQETKELPEDCEAVVLKPFVDSMVQELKGPSVFFTSVHLITKSITCCFAGGSSALLASTVTHHVFAHCQPIRWDEKWEMDQRKRDETGSRLI
jgi:Tfp pilus assembly PilM family ATPase